MSKSPRDFMSRVTGPSADLAVIHMGMFYQANTGGNCQVPVVTVETENPSIRLMPPNYATIVGLKALLLRLPQLHSQAGASMSRVLHAR